MYKLFIVEDEPSTRSGLRDCFDWGKYGVEVVGEADDGLPALEEIARVNPDIVITDVKMPNMDGIALAKALRQVHARARVIFISGYDDLDYLKSALKVDAVDYLLKPINLSEMGLVIEKTLNDLRSDEEQDQMIRNMSNKLRQSMPLLREKFFLTLIHDRIENPQKIIDRMDFLELKLPINGPVCPFVIMVDDMARAYEKLSETEKQLLSFAVLNICQELIDERCEGYAFEDTQGEFVCLLHIGSREEEDLLCLASAIRENLKKHLDIGVTIGIGNVVRDIALLRDSCQNAREAAGQRLFLGKNRIISMDSLETNVPKPPSFSPAEAERLVSAVKAADEGRVLGILEELFHRLKERRYKNIRYCQNICCQLLLLPSRLLMDMDLNGCDMPGFEEPIFESLLCAETLEDMKALILSHYRDACSYIRNKRSGKSRNVIEQIKSIIRERYTQNLTVADIADDIHLTSTYVCLIFKQETGETINEYITRVRMQNAMRLLREGRHKLYEVCTSVGYADPSYFAKLFRKHTGLSPAQYREKSL